MANMDDSASDIPVTNGLIDHDANPSSFNNDSDMDAPFTIDEMLFADTSNMVDTVNNVTDNLLSEFSPLVASMKFYGDMPSAIIPNASVNFPHIIKKAPFRSDNALAVVDPDGVVPTFGVIGRICEANGGNTHKAGPYFDMAPFNGEISFDTFRRAKLRTLVTHASTVSSPPYTPSEMSIVAKAKTKFERLIGFLQIAFGTYVDQAAERDHTLYPAGVDNNGWVRQSSGDYCLPVVSSPIFGNVPRGSTPTASVTPADLHQGILPSPQEMSRRRQQQNLAAFTVPPLPEADADLTQIRLGHFPDPESYYLKLAREHNLSGVKILIPEFYDAQGVLVHPIKYNDTFRVGTMVAMDIQPYMWDMTYSRRDVNVPVDRPARHASMHIVKMRVLPTTEEDFRLLIHQYAVLTLRQRQEEKDASELAEQHCAQLQAALVSTPVSTPTPPNSEITTSSNGSQSKKRTFDSTTSDGPSESSSDVQVDGPPLKTLRTSGGRKQPKRGTANPSPTTMTARQMEKQRELPDAEPMDEDWYEESYSSHNCIF
ncbi:hypothetical protein C8R42DRAFT_720737 [Lentinula raphanica]|nr:hypothetical protein C8R42DRAFT_720737 [Lentinula raphanica]